MTVLGAAAGLEADDALDLDLGPAPAHPHIVGQRQQFLEPVVGQLQHFQDLVAGQSFATLENLFASLIQDVNCCLGHAGQVSAPGSSDQQMVDPLVGVPAAQADGRAGEIVADRVDHRHRGTDLLGG